MSTLLSQQAQPGGGSFLLQQTDDTKWHRNRKTKVFSFLAQPSDARVENVKYTQSMETFLQIYGNQSHNQPTSSAANEAAKPRTTIDQEKLLSISTSEKSTPSAPPPQPQPPLQSPPTTFTERRASPTYAIKKTEYDIRSMASSTVTKAVPPHLRPRKTSPPAGSSAPNKPSVPVEINIREKLSELGVNVSAPKPASQTSEASANARRGGSTRGRGVRGGGNQPARLLEFVADVSAPKPSTDYRGQGHGGGNARNARWPSKADFPDPDTKRWETSWDDLHKSVSDSIDSARADGGWGEDTRKRSKDAAGYPLTDWDGNWAPPPIDWDSRPAFRDGQSYRGIMQWLGCIETHMCGVNSRISMDDFKVDGTMYKFAMPEEQPDTEEGVVLPMGDMLPPYWIPIVIGKQAPQTFWNELVKSVTPTTEDDEEDGKGGHDLDGVKPFWELVVQGGHFQEVPVFPRIAGVSTDETSDERLKRESDHGSFQHSENRKRFEKSKREAKLLKVKYKEEKAKKLAARLTNDAKHEPSNCIKPGLNMYVRSARPSDMKEICDIFNYYIDFSCAAPEVQRRTPAEITESYHAIFQSKLPFLVACERGGVLKARRKKSFKQSEEDIILPDKIVGFAYANDFNDMKNMYRYTAEMEFYTHKDRYMKGVAKCLVDKLMAMLDPDYLERGGYAIDGDELDAVAPRRFIKNIIINFPYENPDRMTWVSKWLENWLGFRLAGELDGIGSKGVPVNLAIFQRSTGAVLDDANPPSTIIKSAL